MEDQKTPTITSVAISCQKGITKLWAAVTTNDCCVRDFLHVREVQQMEDRYNQWAGNLGALQHFESTLSLEHRLRNAPLVRDSILNTLIDLCASIQAATDIAAGRLENRKTGPSIIELDTDLFEYNLSSSGSDTSSILSSGSGRNALAPTSEIQELISAIGTGIDSLFKASIFIRRFAPEDKRQRAAKTKAFDNRADVMYVNDRYPSLRHKNITLAACLGEANARRRQYFKYRRDHDVRLSTMDSKDDSDPIIQKQPGVIAQIPEPVKSIVTTETKPSLIAETEATLFVLDAATQPRMLEMYEIPPATSVVSIATSVAETSDEELTFPPVPAAAQSGSPFLCPYCLVVLQLKREGSENQWRKHVLRDLEPYICTFSSCGLDSFQSQHAWFEHELLIHRTQWICSQCVTSFHSSDDLKKHTSQRHRDFVSDRQLSTFVDQSRRPIDSIRPNECPFCNGSWVKVDSSLKTDEEILLVDLDQFRRHLGHHLQQVALFALPKFVPDQDLSLGSDDVCGFPDQDVISKGSKWVRDDCGHGWRIISRKQTTIFAFAAFLTLYRTHSKYTSEELVSMSTLASTYCTQGLYEMAERLEVQVMKLRIKALGAEHPDTLASVDSLAIILQSQGKYKEAEEMSQRALKGREKVLRPEHPDTLASVSNLASLFAIDGKLVEAQGLLERALNGYETRLGPMQPTTLDVVAKLGKLYADQGKLAEAENMYLRALRGYEEALSLIHPTTLDVVAKLGKLYADQGKLAEAEDMYQRALEGYKKLEVSDLSEEGSIEQSLSNVRRLIEADRSIDT